MKQRKELKVSAIENGTVIDHIPSSSVFDVINILDLASFSNPLTIASNLDSKKYGKKGIIKVANKFFKSEEINKISVVAPTATLIIIKDYKVEEKKKVKTPRTINRFVKCVNPSCITNHEEIPTNFKVNSKKGEPLELRCHYCEKFTRQENMEFI